MGEKRRSLKSTKKLYKILVVSCIIISIYHLSDDSLVAYSLITYSPAL